MAEEISWEIREDAYNLYVTDGKTFEQVAALTGVSLSQLKRWGQSEGWADAKREYREALQSIKRDTVKLRAGLLKKALSSQDAQDVYAFAALERIEAGRKNSSNTTASNSNGSLYGGESPEKLKDIKTPQDAVEALQEVIEIRLNRLLTSPDEVKLSQVKELKTTMELVEQMRQKYKPDIVSEEAKTLDAEAIRNIREQLKL